jgi:acylglycerol lipase
MPWHQDEFVTDDGTALAEYRWPVDQPSAHVVVFHGLAEHLGRYDHVAATFNEAGLTVSGVDIRGHGRSPVPPRSLGSHEQWLDDHAAYLDHVDATTSVPVFVVAHSLGAGLALTLGGLGRLPVAGLVTSGAAVLLPDDLAPMVRKVAGALSRIAPGVRVPGGLASGVSRDPEVVAAYEGDPLVMIKIPARIGMEAIAMIEGVADGLPGVDIPLLVIHGTLDSLTDPAGLELMESTVRSEDATFRPLEGWYHEVFNEPGHEALLAEVVTWIGDRT